MHYPLLRTTWILWSLILFGISGLAFQFFVAPLQKKLLANTRAGEAGTWNDAEYKRLSRCLETLGRDRDAGADHCAVAHGDEAGVRGRRVARGRGIARITHRFLASVAIVVWKRAGRRACRDIRQCVVRAESGKCGDNHGAASCLASV